MAEAKPRKQRDTALATVDKEAPAYLIIYGVCGGLTPFCRMTGEPKSTAHRWLVTGIIPAHRQAHIRGKIEAAGLKLDAALFVPKAA